MVKNIDLEGICHFEAKQEKGLQFEKFDPMTLLNAEECGFHTIGRNA